MFIVGHVNKEVSNCSHMRWASERPGCYHFRGGATCKRDRCENDFELPVYMGYGRFEICRFPSGIAGGIYGGRSAVIRNDTKSTMYPSGILCAATWNRDLNYKLVENWDEMPRQECGILLGPGVNIYRSPLCGRDF